MFLNFYFHGYIYIIYKVCYGLPSVLILEFFSQPCRDVCLSLVSVFGVPFLSPHLVMSPCLFLPVTSLKHMCLSASRHCYLTSCLILIVSCSPCVVFSFASPVSISFSCVPTVPPSLLSAYLCPQSPSAPCCIVRSHCVVLYFLQVPCFHVL